MIAGPSLASLGLYGSHAKAQALSTMSVKDGMTADPLTTTSSTTLAAAAAIMLKNKVGCLPVLEKGQLVGIVTEGDFVAHFARGA
jgi:CBS domain-containing protein